MLAHVAALIPDIGRPLLVAIDGPDAAGKTRFADDLASLLAEQGRTVVRTGIDWFHHPRKHRHALGRSAATVFDRSFDLAAVRRMLLDPWLAGSGSPYVPTLHDLAADEATQATAEPVPESGVLVFDGVFAQRPELVNAWDLAVWLDVDPATSLARMAERDGVDADPDGPGARYLAAQQYYRDTYDPVAAADVVIDNTSWQRPTLLTDAVPAWRRAGDRLTRWVSVPADRLDLAAQIDALLDLE